MLASLRKIALSANRGHLVSDRELRTSLEQHFGSRRFEVRTEVEHRYDQAGGYDQVAKSCAAALDALGDDEMPLFDALEYLNRPAPPTFVASRLARLKASLAGRAESAEDTMLRIDVYAERLEKYPPDVVADVVDAFIDQRKWFPVVSELLPELEGRVRFRRAVLEEFERARNPLLAHARPLAIEADPRLSLSYKEIARREWLPCHREAWIADAEKLADHFERHGQGEKAEEWRRLAAERRALAA